METTARRMPIDRAIRLRSKLRRMRHRLRWPHRAFAAIFIAAIVGMARSAPASAQVDPANFAALQWRLIGPFRAGRVSAGAVDPSDANIYYFGTPGGGVWKSTNAGQTWTAIFDRTGTASIGAIAIAPSNPQVIYVGTGEETRGDGVYKSIDAGKSWTNVGLRDTHYIGSIVVSATNPDEVVVGAIGDRAPGQERGIFRTTDGGKTWTRVLFLDDTAGWPLGRRGARRTARAVCDALPFVGDQRRLARTAAHGRRTSAGAGRATVQTGRCHFHIH
jgi:hypothetical protein